MRTFNFWCIEDECSVSGNNWISLEDDQKDVPVDCLECGKPMKRIGEKAGMTIAMTMDQRVAHYKAQSKEHFQKEIRPEKNRLDRVVRGLKD